MEGCCVFVGKVPGPRGFQTLDGLADLGWQSWPTGLQEA